MISNKKSAAALVFFIILGILMTVLMPTSISKEDTIEKPTYEKGDQWTYRSYMYDYNATGHQYVWGVANITKTISGTEKLTINGENFDVFKVNQSTVVNIIDGSTEVYTTTSYLRKNDLALVRKEEKALIQGKVSTMIRNYNPPVLLFDYPVTVGKQWRVNSTVSNPQTDNSSRVSTFYQCINKTSISVPAGDYDNCYIVETVLPSGNDSYIGTYFYLHPEVDQCLIESYYFASIGDLENLSNGRLTEYTELVSTTYEPGQESSDTPGFAMPLLLLAIAATIVLIGKKQIG